MPRTETPYKYVVLFHIRYQFLQIFILDVFQNHFSILFTFLCPVCYVLIHRISVALP